MLVLNEITVTIEKKNILGPLSLEIPSGKIYAIMGHNGSGKTTLFKAITGLQALSSGSILLDQENISSQPAHIRSKKIATVNQNPYSSIASELTIEENLILALCRGSEHRLKNAYKKERTDFFKEQLETLKMGLEKRLYDKAKTLSGGQLQAMSVIMATIAPCKILLLDEITSALDPEASERIMEITYAIIKKNNLTTLMISHSHEEVEKYAEKTYHLLQGKKIIK